jgi:hypothetical protein
MKKYSLFLIVVFLISFQQLRAQDQAKTDKDKEMQQSIEQQKKAVANQKKAKAEAEQNLKDNQMGEIVDDSLENSDKLRTKIYMNVDRNRNRSFNFDNEPFVFSGQDMNGWFDHSMGDSERSTWDFSKTVKENTFSRDYTFDVEKTAKTVVMSVMGDCKSGEIRIKIIMPNGKNYSDILIDESGNLNWRKSFPISETENQDKAGDWKFQISSTKATGFFKISLQTY